jgi:hypothetical protein
MSKISCQTKFDISSVLYVDSVFRERYDFHWQYDADEKKENNRNTAAAARMPGAAEAPGVARCQEAAGSSEDAESPGGSGVPISGGEARSVGDANYHAAVRLDSVGLHETVVNQELWGGGGGEGYERLGL